MKTQVRKARNLRHNMTDAEKRLWSKLRNRQLNNRKFRRQVPKGPYILDFYCPEKKIVIEVDGGQHYNTHIHKYDRKREKYLRDLNFTVIRYSNRDVFLNIDAVLNSILENLE